MKDFIGFIGETQFIGQGGGAQPPAPFSPLQLSNLAAWYDFSDTATLTGDPITAAADKSGNGNTLTTAIGPTRSTENGLNTALFNGTTQYLENEALGAITNGDGNLFTVHIAFKHTTGADGCIYGFCNSAANEYYAVRIQANTLRSIGADGSVAPVDNITAERNDEVTVLSYLRNNDSFDAYVNSFRTNLADSQALGDVATNRFTLGGIYFNGAITTGSLLWPGEICEVIIQSAKATVEEVEQVAAYLQTKWANAVEGDIFVVAGQSNAVGNPNGSGSASPIVPDSAYIYDPSDNSIASFAEPWGGEAGGKFDPSNAGSAWGAFAQRWKTLTGRDAIFVGLAANGSRVIEGAGSDSWNIDDADLYPAFKTAFDAALLSSKTAFKYNTDNIKVLWCQGEGDGTYITAGSGNGVQYQTDLQQLVNQIVVTDFPTTQFCIIRTGTLCPGNGTLTAVDTVGLQAVRDAQENVAFNTAKAIMAYRDTIDFAVDGLMVNSGGDQVHYNQDGLNLMGVQSAINIYNGGLVEQEITPPNSPVQYNAAELKRRLIVNGGADVRMFMLVDSNGAQARLGNPNAFLGSSFGNSFCGYMVQGTNVAAAWSTDTLNLGQTGASPDTHDSRFGSGPVRDAFDYRLQQATSNVSGHTIPGQYLAAQRLQFYQDTGVACKTILKRPLTAATDFVVNGRIHANRSDNNIPNSARVDDTADFTVTDGGGWFSTPWVFTNPDVTSDRHGSCLTFDDGGDETGDAAGVVGVLMTRKYRDAPDRRKGWVVGSSGDGGWSTQTHLRSTGGDTVNYWNADTLLATLTSAGEGLPNVICLQLGHNDATSSQASDPDEFWDNVDGIVARIDALYTSLGAELPLYWVSQLWNFPNLFANGKARIATYYGISQGQVTQAIADAYWDEYAVKAATRATGRIAFTSLNRKINGVIPDVNSEYDWLDDTQELPNDGVHMRQNDTASQQECYSLIWDCIDAAASLPAQEAPEILDGVIAWWDSSDNSTIANNAGIITWTDKINGLEAVSDGAGITVTNGGLGGRQVIDSNGANVMAISGALLDFEGQTDPFSIVAAYRADGVGWFMAKANSGTGSATQWAFGTSANEARVQVGGTQTAVGGFTYPSSRVISMTVPAASTGLMLHIDGDAGTSGDVGAAVPTNFDPNPLFFGRRSTSQGGVTGFRLNGAAYQAIVANIELTPSMRVFLEDFAATKSGVTLS